MLTANVIAVLEDECFKAEVDAERGRLRAAADAPTDVQAHEPSDSPAPATPISWLASPQRTWMRAISA